MNTAETSVNEQTGHQSQNEETETVLDKHIKITAGSKIYCPLVKVKYVLLFTQHIIIFTLIIENIWTQYLKSLSLFCLKH